MRATYDSRFDVVKMIVLSWKEYVWDVVYVFDDVYTLCFFNSNQQRKTINSSEPNRNKIEFTLLITHLKI